MTRIHLTPAERQALLTHYRRAADPDIRLRAHILLLLAAGYPWETISAVLFCSTSAIGRWKWRFEREGVDTVFGRPRGRRRSGIHIWATLVVRWVLMLSPTDFRFARSRWSCEAAAVVLRDDFRVRVGRETVRLWLRADGLVWRRPRPVIRPKDPDRERKLADLRSLLRGLPADETAVFMDEVDVNLNPKVGCQWMRRGGQAAVETPGTNEKRYIAGSIHWRTGRVFLTEGEPKEGRGAALFLRHVDDLRRAFRRGTPSYIAPEQARGEEVGDRDVHPVRRGDGEEVQDVRGDVAAGRGRDPGRAGGRAARVGGVLLHRPGRHGGRHPRRSRRPLLAGNHIPGLQGDRRGGPTAGAIHPGQRRGVPRLLVDVHDDRGMGVGPGRGGSVCHRSASPWDDEPRRPSHADKRRAWRRELLGNEIRAVLRAGVTERELQAATGRLLNLAA